MKEMKVKDVADVLGVKEHSVYNFVHSGKLPVRKIGNKLLRFNSEDVQAFKERRDKVQDLKEVGLKPVPEVKEQSRYSKAVAIVDRDELYELIQKAIRETTIVATFQV